VNRRLEEYDYNICKGSVDFKEAQKAHALTQSAAGKRAIEIETMSLADRMCIERGISDDIKARTLVQLEAKELALQRVKVQMDFIADFFDYIKNKQGLEYLPNAERYGAFLLAAKIPQHGISAAQITKLHVRELTELIDLKEGPIFSKRTKPDLVE
jgi:hypothetical protein